VVRGGDDGNFNPEASITRAEFATLVSRFDELEDNGERMFTDITGHWAETYINSAAQKGWLRGDEKGNFNPEDSLTRAQIVAIVNRMLGRKLDLADIPTRIVVDYPDLGSTHWAYCDIIEASYNHEAHKNSEGNEQWIKDTVNTNDSERYYEDYLKARQIASQQY